MAGFAVSTDEHLIRSDVWTKEIKDVLDEDLIGQKYVRWLTEFVDGDVFHMPSIGDAEVRDYEEGTAVTYTGMDTGEFTFSVTEYKASATYIYNKFKQDSFYMSEVESSFVPKQARAIQEVMEADVLRIGPLGQTASDYNLINGARHRYVATGTNETMTIQDIAKARFALQKANVPMTNLIGIVDPSVEFTFNTLTNLVNLSFNPRWEGIVSTSIGTGMKFLVSIEGFDLYTSNFLPDINETIGGLTTAAGKGNLFFSATADVLPFVGAVRQAPRVDSSYNKDWQRDEYVTTTRYGFKLFRPENLVTILADTDQVYA